MPWRLPIAFIHQDLGLIDWMTVAENICMTLGFPRRLGMIDRAAARRRAATALEALGADIDPEARIQNLGRTEKSLVAIARALAAEPEILVLDEPTASLPADEVARLFSALRRLRAHGVAMIYVSHRLDEVFEIADRMVVLRDGRVAGEREVAKTTPDETILLIVGREPSQVFRRPPDRHGSPRLALRSVTVEAVGPVDCTIDSGEIVGLVGLRGAGQESVGRALFGVWPVTVGQVLLDGRQMTSRRCGRRWRRASISSARTGSARLRMRADPAGRRAGRRATSRGRNSHGGRSSECAGIANRIGRTRCGAILSQMSRSASAARTRKNPLRSSTERSPWIRRDVAEDAARAEVALLQQDHPQAAAGGVARHADTV